MEVLLDVGVLVQFYGFVDVGEYVQVFILFYFFIVSRLVWCIGLFNIKIQQVFCYLNFFIQLFSKGKGIQVFVINVFCDNINFRSYFVVIEQVICKVGVKVE